MTTKNKLLTLFCALFLAIGVSVTAALATVPAPSLSVKTLNLSVENAVYMVFKVANEGVATEDMRLLVWEDVPNAYTKGTEDACLTSTEVEGGTGYTVFRYTDLAAKDMTKTVYACAYASVNGTDVYSAPVKYSIVMYADIQKEATDPDEDLVAFLDAMLAYGAAAQTYFEHNTDFLASDEVHKVTVVNGKLQDGFSLGWVKEGATVTVTADAPEGGFVFSYWKNAAGAPVATTETATLPVNNAETYTAVYESAVQEYSQGLEYATNDDGTCYVVGMGECTDTTLVIPPLSPDTDIVIGIDRSAFAGEPITCVVLPNTIEEIGRQAFNGCTSLTDVYYDGTEDEWNERVDVVTTGNAPFLAATMHFKAAPVVTYTVTFLDYDGTPLKTDTVVSGGAATAPEAPTRDGYSFTGWDKSFDNVTSDVTVTAVYERVFVAPTVVVDEVIVDANAETVDVVISIANNPGISSLKFDVVYDDTLLALTAVTFDTAFGSYVTTPEPYENPQTVTFISPLSEVTTSGDFATLTFDISALTEIGSVAEITVVLYPDEIYDENFTDVTFDVANGRITVE